MSKPQPIEAETHLNPQLPPERLNAIPDDLLKRFDEGSASAIEVIDHATADLKLMGRSTKTRPGSEEAYLHTIMAIPTKPFRPREVEMVRQIAAADGWELNGDQDPYIDEYGQPTYDGEITTLRLTNPEHIPDRLENDSRTPSGAPLS